MFDKRKDVVEKNQESSHVEVEPRPTKPTPSRVTATIGETISIEGSISGTENLIINGKVNGSVALAKHDLTIGACGKIAADLVCKSVKVDGEVTGDINGSEVVVVSNTGQVRGNITAPRVTLEDGAKFKGSIDMDPVNKKIDTPPVAAAAELRTADAKG